MSAVTGVSAVLNYIYKGSGQALRGLFGRPLHARTVPTVSASDRLSTIVEETITQVRACSDFLVSSPFSFCAI